MGRAQGTPQAASLAGRRTATEQVSEAVLWSTGSVSADDLLVADAGDLKRTPPPAALTYPQRTLLMVGGLYGLGKTTFADRLAGTDAVVIDPDRLAREMELPFSNHWDIIFREMFDRTKATLADGQSVVITIPGLRGWQREELGSIASDTGAQFHAVYLDGDIELSNAGQQARIDDRPDLIEPDVVAMMHDEWVSLRQQLAWAATSGDPADDLDYIGTGMQSAVVLDRAAANAVQSLRFTA